MRWLTIIALVVVASGIALVLGASVSLSHSFERSEHAAQQADTATLRALNASGEAAEARRTASENRAIVTAVKESREQSLLHDCRVQDHNNKHAKRYLHHIYVLDAAKTKGLPAAARRKALTEVKTGLDEFDTFIDTLAPQQNCRALERRQTTP